MTLPLRFREEKTLEQMSAEEWEALCGGGANELIKLIRGLAWGLLGLFAGIAHAQEPALLAPQNADAPASVLPRMAAAQGETALHRAAYRYDTKQFFALLEQGANPFQRDDNQQTPIGYLLDAIDHLDTFSDHDELARIELEQPVLQEWASNQISLDAEPHPNPLLRSAPAQMQAAAEAIDAHDAAALKQLLLSNTFYWYAYVLDNHDELTDLLSLSVANLCTQCVQVMQESGFDFNHFRIAHPELNLALLLHRQAETEAQRRNQQQLFKTFLSYVPRQLTNHLGESWLYQAVALNQLELVEVLLNAQADASQMTNRRHLPYADPRLAVESPLMKAVLNGEEEIVELLLNRTDTVALTGSELLTALHMTAHRSARNAAKQGQIASLLLQHGAQVDAKDDSGRTPLRLAVENDRVAVADALLEANANPNAADAGGMTPRQRASDLRRTAILHRMNQQHSSQSSTTEDRAQQALFAAIERIRQQPQEEPQQLALLRTLIRDGIDLERHNEQGKTALYQAVDHHLLSVAALLLDAGANPRTLIIRRTTAEQDAHAESAYFQALRHGHIPMVALLLKHDPNLVFHKDSAGRGSVHALLPNDLRHEARQAELLTWLLQQRNLRINLDGSDYSHRAPLSYAAAQNAQILVRLMLKHRARTSGRVVVSAAYSGNVDMIKLVFSPEQVNYRASTHSDTPLLMLMRNKNVAGADRSQVAQFLLAAGADHTLADSYQNQPLHLAACLPEVEVVEVLLQHGANPDARNSQEQTPADAARACRNNAVLAVLAAANA